MATQTNSPTETAAPARGFGQLPCPLCGADATVRLDLDDLATFNCCECSEDFTADDLRAIIAQWQRVLNWLDTAPVRE